MKSEVGARQAGRWATVAILLAGMLLGLPAATAALSPTASALDGDCPFHPGVRITEDFGPQGFEWVDPLSGAREPRPGAGVTAGRGTTDEPYVIEGWCFVGAGIDISGTTKHVIIRHNHVTGSGVHPDHVGVRVENAANVHIMGNHVQGWGYGIGAWRSSAIIITSNHLEHNLRYGAWAAETPGVEITANTATHNENGLGIGFASDARIAENDIRSSGVVGVLNAFSTGVTFTANRVSGGETGLYVREATDVIIVDNDLVDQHVNGIVFDSAPRGLAENNRVTGSGHEGVIFWSSAQGTVRANDVEGSGFADSRAAIRIAGSPASTVALNKATGSAYGIVLDGSPRSLVNDNLVRGNRDAGVLLWAAAETQVERNTIEANGIGVQIQQTATGIVITRNNIYASTSGIGLDAQGANGTPDADSNWWGCVRGPGHASCDDVVGSIHISKWLRQPERSAPEAPAPGARA